MKFHFSESCQSTFSFGRCPGKLSGSENRLSCMRLRSSRDESSSSTYGFSARCRTMAELLLRSRNRMFFVS